MPALPPVIFTAPLAGSTPLAPAAIYQRAPAGMDRLIITGVATAGINGTLIFAGLFEDIPAWSSDGTLTAGATNTICKRVFFDWKITRGTAYSATKSDFPPVATPNGLTGWTVGTGSGAPTIAASGPTVVEAAVVFTAPSAGAAPAAPGVVFVSPVEANAVAASVTTAFGNAHSNMVITARTPGAAGNNIEFATGVGGINRALSVVVVGNLIDVSLQTNGAAVPTGLASAIKAALEANPEATAKVSVAFAAGNNGSGVALQMTKANLSGGSGGLAPPVAVFGT